MTEDQKKLQVKIENYIRDSKQTAQCLNDNILPVNHAVEFMVIILVRIQFNEL